MKPEDHSSLRPRGPWDIVWRGSFALDHEGAEYVIDADFFDFSERIHLYRDGTLLETRSSPARFNIDADTSVEAAMTLYGMKHVDLVRPGGRRVQFRPRAGTGEAWRADLARQRPVLSRWIGWLSWTVLLFGIVTQIPVYYNLTIARATEMPLPTLDLPVWLNTVLSVAAILAALDRALQLKHNKWID